jgi:penicillin V acylase-like amidase (Ntn superfamily)
VGQLRIHDRAGRSRAAAGHRRTADGKLVIHHGKQYTVMTNSPTFDQQLALNAYCESAFSPAGEVTRHFRTASPFAFAGVKN